VVSAFWGPDQDDIPRVLRGLQYIYINEPVREEIFGLLKANIQPAVDKNTGRPGMDYWTILVMGVLRLGMNWDYDALHEQVNEHGKIRQMLGHADDLGKYEYQLQTIKDNVKLFKPELLDKINEVVVKAGHALVKKKDGELLKGRVE
jgi:IS5 family transposase